MVKPSLTSFNPHVLLPICEHFKIRNGRVVLVKREKHRTWRQGQVKSELSDKQPVQVIMLQNWVWFSDLMRLDLDFMSAIYQLLLTTMLLSAMNQRSASLFIKYLNINFCLKCFGWFHIYVLKMLSLQSTDDWTAILNIVSFGSGDRRCLNDPSDKMFTLPASGRWDFCTVYFAYI